VNDLTFSMGGEQYQMPDGVPSLLYLSTSDAQTYRFFIGCWRWVWWNFCPRMRQLGKHDSDASIV